MVIHALHSARPPRPSPKERRTDRCGAHTGAQRSLRELPCRAIFATPRELLPAAAVAPAAAAACLF